VTAPLVFITGASSGIGQALAARYAQAGWRLALVARRVARSSAPGPRRRAWAPDRAAVYAADVARSTASSPPATHCIARSRACPTW
jgi:NAD(P)-dependent dehydrogenase (short-subunit alcohol dehydrogenase family)